MGTRPEPRPARPRPTADEGLPQSCYVEPETRYALANRNAILCGGGSCDGPFGAELGRFRIDAKGQRASLRFTSPADTTARAIWLYVARATSQGRMLVSLRDDQDGRPAPGATPSSVTLRLAPGWQRVELPRAGAKALTRCAVYHVLIERDPAGGVGDAGSVDLVTTVSRFPVPYQPRVPAGEGLRSFLDLSQAFLFEDSPAGLLPRWDATNFQYDPIFVIEAQDGSTFGQPYDHLTFPAVMGSARIGERLHVPAAVGAPIPVNYVAVFGQRQANGGTDQLFVELLDEATKEVLARAKVVHHNQGVTSRAHWFGGAFEAGGLGLQPERNYLLMLHSDDGGKNPLGFAFPALRSTLRRTPGLEDATWGGAASHMVVSPDGGQSFFAAAARPDLPLLLAQRDDTSAPLAIYDEGGVYHADDSAALTASPGEPLHFGFVVRNIGLTAGTLFYQLVDAGTGLPLTGEPVLVPNAQPNSDAGAGSSVVVAAPMVEGPWRVDVQCGHVAGPDQLVVDDVVRFEVRVV